MEKLKTIINWTLNDYCKSQCEYCPTHLRGGGLPHETADYLRVANLIIDTYSKMGRTIEWTFDGGEPLDMDDIVMLLKLCRTTGDAMTLHTNGGRLWLDWWAIEPYVDNLHLTIHYWQNPYLVRFIVDAFRSKGKRINITAPIRHDFVKTDLKKILEIEELCNIQVTRTILYKNADANGGMYPYETAHLDEISFFNLPAEERKRIIEEQEAAKRQAEEPVIEEPIFEEEPEVEIIQLPPLEIPVVEEIIFPVSELTEEKIYFQETTWEERYETTYSAHPSFTGQMCNVGIEALHIGAQGWVSGSHCNNQPLGNIWHDGWAPPTGPQKCTMISCISDSDQRITKFPLNGL